VLLFSCCQVVSHAGNAFKVVELLAQDIQGGSSTCMCALRATQNLLHTYATSAAGDAGDRSVQLMQHVLALLQACLPHRCMLQHPCAGTLWSKPVSCK
jgi:hypothetical protein